MQKIQLDDHGSFVVEGPRYQVFQFRGPVAYRQDQANERRVKCYFEAHLNAMGGKVVKDAVFAIAAYKHSIDWGKRFSAKAAEALSIRNDHVIVGAHGYGLVSRLRWPTQGLVLEPGFISNKDFVDRLVNQGGIELLGRALAESIMDTWPAGCAVGASIGHVYRGTGDQGAMAVTENPAFDREAEIAEAYTEVATRILVAA